MTAEIVEFPVMTWVRAELDGGVVTKSARPELVGRPRYFVNMIDHEGGSLGIWDGASYDAGLEILAECGRDGLAMVDLIAQVRA